MPVPNTPWYKTSRYHLALWAFFGFINVYALRVNLSVAVVKMADEYNWSQSVKGTAYDPHPSTVLCSWVLLGSSSVVSLLLRLHPDPE